MRDRDGAGAIERETRDAQSFFSKVPCLFPKNLVKNQLFFIVGLSNNASLNYPPFYFSHQVKKSQIGTLGYQQKNLGQKNLTGKLP